MASAVHTDAADSRLLLAQASPAPILSAKIGPLLRTVITDIDQSNVCIDFERERATHDRPI